MAPRSSGGGASPSTGAESDWPATDAANAMQPDTSGASRCGGGGETATASVHVACSNIRPAHLPGEGGGNPSTCSDCASTQQRNTATHDSVITRNDPDFYQFTVNTSTPIPKLGASFSVSINRHTGEVSYSTTPGVGQNGVMATANWIVAGHIDTQQFLSSDVSSVSAGLGVAGQVSWTTDSEGNPAVAIGIGAGIGTGASFTIQTNHSSRRLRNRGCPYPGRCTGP